MDGNAPHESQRVVEIYLGEPRERPPRDQMSAAFMRSAGIVDQHFAECGMAGFVIVGVDAEGGWSLGYRVDAASPIGINMLAGIAISAINADLLVENRVREILERNGLVRPETQP